MCCTKFGVLSVTIAALILLVAAATWAADGDPPAASAEEKPAAKSPLAPAAIDAVAAHADVSAEKKIRAALERKIDFEFIDTPLKDVTTYLQDVSGVTFVIDRKALEGAGVGVDSPISLSVRGIKLRSGLNLALKQLDGNLAWMIRDEVLYITTRDEANAHSVIRVYNVRDLLGNADAEPSGPTADEFVGTIKSAVMPESWNDQGGAGSVQPFDGAGTLIITQSAAAHEAIESLLEQLRESRPSTAGK